MITYLRLQFWMPQEPKYFRGGDCSLIASKQRLHRFETWIVSRFVFDIAANYTSQYYSISIKVNNLFDHQHMLPGIKAADSGNDFTQRSLGFTNSLIPQNSRSVWLTLEFYL